MEKKGSRLRFIDMTRGIALLLMIEGHFTGAALQNAYRSENYALFSIWQFVHGHTAPLFFIITGLIFVYLLSGTDTSTPFVRNPRVIKGFTRAAELLVWGYVIQLEMRSLYYWVFRNGTISFDWLCAFHVLQSISISLLLLLAIFALYRKIPKVPLFAYYLVAAAVLFACMSVLNTYIGAELKASAATGLPPRYLPVGFPAFFQNLVFGPYSEFSVLRYGGFIMLGGAIGNVVRLFERKDQIATLGLYMFAGSLAVYFIMRYNMYYVAQIDYHLNIMKGMLAVSFISLLMLVDARYGFHIPLLSRLGRNTFPIYIIHVVILYGGFTGLGLKPWLVDANMNPLQTVCFSLGALVFFSTLPFVIDAVVARTRRS